MGYCQWYNKKLEDVAESEQAQCEEMGDSCSKCQFLVIYGEDEGNVCE